MTLPLAIELGDSLLAWIGAFAVALLTLSLGIGLQRMSNRRRPGQRVPFQLAVLALWSLGLLAVVMLLPIDGERRGQLLGFFGIVASAAIALASTTLLGNGLAGIMLRLVREFRVGDFVRIEGVFGRVTERGLIHTEIQTEDRDLTTLPNLYLVSHPLTIVRASGTILSTKISLGYDVSRHAIEKSLLRAATNVGLEHPFVQIIELGDYSVLYRVAGVLNNVEAIVSSRSKLNGAVLDALHEDAIEIVSPTIMTTRKADGEVFIPESHPLARRAQPAGARDNADYVMFDKAQDASSLAELEGEVAATKKELEGLGKDQVEAREALKGRLAALEAEVQERRARLEEKS